MNKHNERAELIRNLRNLAKTDCQIDGMDVDRHICWRAAAMLEAQRPALKPLTDEQIGKMYRATQLGDGCIMLRSDYERGIRDAEAAHGIKEQA